MFPLEREGGDHDNVTPSAVTLVTVRSSGAESGARAGPEPEEKSPDIPHTRESRREGRQRENMW